MQVRARRFSPHLENIGPVLAEILKFRDVVIDRLEIFPSWHVREMHREPVIPPDGLVREHDFNSRSLLN